MDSLWTNGLGGADEQARERRVHAECKVYVCTVMLTDEHLGGDAKWKQIVRICEILSN